MAANVIKFDTSHSRRGIYGSLGYRSVRIASSEGRSYTAYPGSAHDERDRGRLIDQSRYFMRNNAIYKGMIERMVSYIVGNGFALQIESSNKNAVDKLEGLWADWFARPEIRNVLSGAQLSRMLIRELLVAGDIPILKTDKGLLQVFEAEQLDGDRSYLNGIKKDKYGRPVFFHLCPWKSYSVDKKNGRGYPAKDILFLSNPERPSQIRGIPASQASFPMLHRLNDICDSEAIARQMLSRIAVSIEREQGPEQGYTESKADPNKTTDSTEGDAATRVTELDYALLFHANPGDKITGIDRNIPGEDFPAIVRIFLRLLGLPLGCPLELILLDWTQSNYSQSRAVLEQAFENFIMFQRILIDFFYQPCFEWKYSGWKNSNGLKSAKIRASWITPTFPWIDQLKEAMAQATKVERGFVTHRQVCKSLNTDRDEVIEQREKEVVDAIERAKRIKKKYEVEVPWEIFAGLKPPASKGTLAKTADVNKQEKE